MLNQSLVNQSVFWKFLTENPLLLIILTIWIVAWKGVALWKAARLSHKWWFIIILVVNTIGIIEIIYIYFVSRKYTVEEKVEEGGVA